MFVGESRFWPLICALGLIGCGGAWPALDVDAVRAEGLRVAPAAGWRVLSDEAVVTYRPGGAEPIMSVRRHTVRHFPTPTLHQWTERIAYDAGTLEHLEMRARHLVPGGEDAVFEDADAHDAPYFDAVSVMDTRTRTLEIGGVRPGSVLETASEHSTRVRTAGEGQFWFVGPGSADQARLEIRVPEGFELEWAASPEAFAPQVSPSPEGKVFVWVQQRPPGTAPPPEGAGRAVSYRLRAWPGGAPRLTPKAISAWAAS